MFNIYIVTAVSFNRIGAKRYGTCIHVHTCTVVPDTDLAGYPAARYPDIFHFNFKKSYIIFDTNIYILCILLPDIRSGRVPDNHKCRISGTSLHIHVLFNYFFVIDRIRKSKIVTDSEKDRIQQIGIIHTLCFSDLL